MGKLLNFPAIAGTAAATANPDYQSGHGPDHPNASGAALAMLPTTGGRRCEYAVGDLARMFGLGEFSQRTIIRYLRAMAEDEGLPLPKTPRLYQDRILRGAQSIHCKSRWDAERVDGWHLQRDNQENPPAASAALRNAMADRALEMAKSGASNLASA